MNIPGSRTGISSLIYGSLQSNDFCPRHDELFVHLGQGARPPLAVEDARQRVDRSDRFRDAGDLGGIPVVSDEGASWIVEFRHGSRPDGFRAACRGSWLDLDAVLMPLHPRSATPEAGRTGPAAPRVMQCVNPVC
jgi:hypothetical protein